MPANRPITALEVSTNSGNPYPEPFHSRMGDITWRALGDQFGLTQFGFNLETLEPGGQSSLRHWHTLEDEFVYVLSGEVVLVSNEGEQVLTAGMCAGYPAGAKNAHHFVNRSGKPVRYLEIGDRAPGDNALYPDDDLLWVEDEKGVYTAHKDGRRY
jgi:uncharacterized cupin superfamily protein